MMSKPFCLKLDHVQCCTSCNFWVSSLLNTMVEQVLPKCAPGVKLALQALNVGQEVDDIHVCKILLESNSSCIPKATLLVAGNDKIRRRRSTWSNTADCKECRTSDFRRLCVQHTKVVRATRIGCQKVTCMHHPFNDDGPWQSKGIEAAAINFTW